MVIQAHPTTKGKGPNGPNRPSPVASIAKIACLKRFDNRDYALDTLHYLAKAVAPLMHQYGFKIGMLCEMYPKDLLLLGLNVNKGQKILIRLRQPHAENAFYPMSDLVGTMLHELTHNVHGPHNDQFYALLGELRKKYDSGNFDSSYVCEENSLGGGYVAPWEKPKTVRQKRLEALSKGKYKAEAQRLGGSRVLALPAAMREAMLKAAEQRILDSKWCHLGEANEQDLVGEVQEVEFVDMTTPRPEKLREYKEVIDLTREEEKLGSTNEDLVEVIEVDACEVPDSNSLWANKLRPPVGTESQFGTGKFKVGENPQIHYTVSSSPGKTFIGDELRYPRRKMVANLVFEQIIESGMLDEKTRTPLPKPKPEVAKRAHPPEEKKPSDKKSRNRKDSRKSKRPHRAKSDKSQLPSSDPPAQASAQGVSQEPDQKRRPSKAVRTVSFDELLKM